MGLGTVNGDMCVTRTNIYDIIIIKIIIFFATFHQLIPEGLPTDSLAISIPITTLRKFSSDHKEIAAFDEIYYKS
jgi:hypothetical protein